VHSVKATGAKFWILVAVPLLAATLGIYWLTFELMDRVSNDANMADHVRTRQVVASAFKENENSLADLATDNANWDDAAESAYGEIDPQWFAESWGDATEEAVNYGVSAVVERGNPDAVFAYLHGGKTDLNVDRYFKGELDRLLDQVPQTTEEHGSFGATIDTQEGIAVVAVSNIMPITKDKKVDAEKTRFLVFAKHMTPEVVAEIGSKYIVTDLKIGPISANSIGVPVAETNGKIVAEASWTDGRPGDHAREAIITKMMAALGFFSLVMLGTGILCRRLMGSLARRELAAKQEATHDALTGLKNRAALTAELEQLSQQPGNVYALVYADIDGFKDVNDTYDHTVGDKLIRYIAHGLTHLAAQHNAFVARVGGDEFVTILKGQSAPAAANIFANALITFLKDPIDIEGRFATVGASVGIAAFAGEKVGAAEIMRRADVAMYEAKRTGKNRAVSYRKDIEEHRHQTHETLAGLRKIIADKSIEIAFQPIVDAATRKIVAAETLARWPKDVQPAFGPQEFISVAETHGLIGPLGEQILEKACQQASAWPDLRICYNLSPVQLRDPGFVQRALTIITSATLLPSRVEFEVTESILVEDMGLARKQLERLRAAGCSIALDDFGSGYSSVGYLQKLTFDRIKLDRSIVEGVATGVLEQGIAHGTVLMAKGMSAKVTAEGVENEEQAQILRLAGCSEFQGYYFHRPLDAAGIGNLLKRADTEAARHIA
jgi:diguanylate cyclase (GGDEF)-like protein